MSTTSKIALGIATGFSVGIVYYVHYSQKQDKERLQGGIIRDMERQSRKIQNIKKLQDQIELTKVLKREREEADELKRNSSS